MRHQPRGDETAVIGDGLGTSHHEQRVGRWTRVVALSKQSSTDSQKSTKTLSSHFAILQEPHPGKSKKKLYTMFLIIEIIHLNIFKNCSAVELTWELSFY